MEKNTKTLLVCDGFHEPPLLENQNQLDTFPAALFLNILI